MASGSRSSLASLLIAAGIVLGGCAAGGADNVPTSSSAAPTTTTTTQSTTSVPPATTTTAETTTTTTDSGATDSTMPSSTTTAGAADLGADIRVPAGEGPFPAVVLVHGGGWVSGDPSVMTDLAVYLTDNGFLTVNTPYQLAADRAGFPAAVDDVACAVRLAASLPESNGSVTVLGHSAGAHLSALVALTGDLYGPDCPYPDTGRPGALVGLAGPYDVDRLGLLMLPFFGGGPSVEPEAWVAGNPMKQIEGHADFSSLIMFGDRDSLVDPSFAIDFHQALVDEGADSTLELVEGARHMDLRDPAIVGELIVTWLERES